jgi:hypothetical protein
MSISSQKCRQLLIFASNLLNFLANLIDVIVVVLMTLFGGNGLLLPLAGLYLFIYESL